MVRLCLAIALVAAALGACAIAAAGRADRVALSAAWPKVSHLRDGSTVSVWRNGRVVERSRGGRVLSESNCGSYARYERWVRFMGGFRTAVLTEDHARVAGSVSWPLLWNHGRPWHSTSISGAAELISLYEAVFVPAVVREIKEADPRALFCRDVTMVMLGLGVAWGDEPGGQPAIVSINGQP